MVLIMEVEDGKSRFNWFFKTGRYVGGLWDKAAGSVPGTCDKMGCRPDAPLVPESPRFLGLGVCPKLISG